MTKSDVQIPDRRLRTPRSAAIAGIVFGILSITSFILVQTSVPDDSITTTEWLQNQARTVSFAISLMPFAGIAFLWFMGVVRDRIGDLEDQFFSTLFFGSGILYLAMSFASAAIAGGLLTLYSLDPNVLVEGGVYTFSRAVIYNFTNEFAIRMSGMHMFVLGTIWMRTRVMHRWLTLFTYGLALALIIGAGFIKWLSLAFPIWVLVISLATLHVNYRGRREEENGENVE